MISGQTLMSLSLPLTQGCPSQPFPGRVGDPGPRCPSVSGEADVSPGSGPGAAGGGRHMTAGRRRIGRGGKRAHTRTGFARLPQCFENLNPCLCGPLAARAHTAATGEVTEVSCFLAAASAPTDQTNRALGKLSNVSLSAPAGPTARS